MSILLETNLGGDLVIDLDLEGSPALCRNFLKLAKVRYYTSSLIYNVHNHRFFQAGDPTGTGQGGACIYGVLDAAATAIHGKGTEMTSDKRFLKSSSGRRLTATECRQPGRVVAMELNHTPDTIGSQFLITLGKGRPGDALDDYQWMGDDRHSSSNTSSSHHGGGTPLSLGVVTEDDDGVLDKIEASYCDTEGRPYADIRIVRMLILHDPFPDPPGLWEYLRQQPGMVIENEQIVASPDRSKPPQESVAERIPANELDLVVEETEEQIRERQEKEARQEDHQRAVVLELLGDLPSADYKAPEHVLFVCKLNPVTQDEDLELIFSRFDPNCKAEIIRDPETGNSLQYAFVEFSNKQQCVEAYFKMNNALVDDRRIKVDFSQSVAKLWDKHTQRLKARQGAKEGPPTHGSTQKHLYVSDRQNFRQGRNQRPPSPRRTRGPSDEFGRSPQQGLDKPSDKRHDRYYNNERSQHPREGRHNSMNSSKNGNRESSREGYPRIERDGYADGKDHERSRYNDNTERRGHDRRNYSDDERNVQKARHESDRDRRRLHDEHQHRRKEHEKGAQRDERGSRERREKRSNVEENSYRSDEGKHERDSQTRRPERSDHDVKDARHHHRHERPNKGESRRNDRSASSEGSDGDNSSRRYRSDEIDKKKKRRMDSDDESSRSRKHKKRRDDHEERKRRKKSKHRRHDDEDGERRRHRDDHEKHRKKERR
jgi:peptidyl-prolyl cis-trans isomerase-like 4